MKKKTKYEWQAEFFGHYIWDLYSSSGEYAAESMFPSNVLNFVFCKIVFLKFSVK